MTFEPVKTVVVDGLALAQQTRVELAEAVGRSIVTVIRSLR